MIIGIGLELVDIGSFQDFLDGRESDVEEGHYTSREMDYCRSKPAGGQHLAAPYAAKVATCKAFGLSPDEMKAHFDHIEIVRTQKGQPKVHLADNLFLDAEDTTPTTLHISISHSANQAVAFVIAEKRTLLTGESS